MLQQFFLYHKNWLFRHKLNLYYIIHAKLFGLKKITNTYNTKSFLCIDYKNDESITTFFSLQSNNTKYIFNKFKFYRIIYKKNKTKNYTPILLKTTQIYIKTTTQLVKLICFEFGVGISHNK